MQPASVNANVLLSSCGAHVLLNDPWRDRNDVIPFPVLDETQRLQSLDNVICADSGQFSNLLN